MADGNSVMKQLRTQIDVDSIDDLANDMNENLQEANEINEALAQPMGGMDAVDESELDDELAMLDDLDAEKVDMENLRDAELAARLSEIKLPSDEPSTNNTTHALNNNTNSGFTGHGELFVRETRPKEALQSVNRQQQHQQQNQSSATKRMTAAQYDQYLSFCRTRNIRPDNNIVVVAAQQNQRITS